VSDNQIIFLGGSPKCGTSAVFSQLSKNQNICTSKPKETFYYIENDNPLINKKTNYIREGHSGFHKLNKCKSDIFLEGTTHLIYQKSLIKCIAELNSKVIFILRAPEKRILSSFNYTKFNLGRIKQGLSFRDYVKILLNNNVNELEEWVSDRRSIYVLKRELDYSNYYDYLNLWMSEMPGRVKVLFYEDLISHKSIFYKDLSSFIGVDLNATSDVKINETKVIRNSIVHYWVSKLRDYGLLKSNLFTPIKRVYNRVQYTKKLNGENDYQNALDDLKNYFNPYNESLSRLLGKQLPW